MAEENKALVRRVEDAWDSGKLDQLDECFASDFVSHSAMPGTPGTLASAKEFHREAVMKAFPDRRVEILDLVAQGDRVVVRARVTGTNKGGFMGVPPNDHPIDAEFISIYRVEDGKIAEHWAVNDGLTLMMQLGAIPGPDPNAG
jgi:steroid delta-isomerase-like uncharacterized protein